MKKSVIVVASLLLLPSLFADAKANGIVSFKDADKIKSWDAWGDHLAKAAITNILQKEKPCVTMSELKRLKPGKDLKEIGLLKTRKSNEIKSSNWSIGCETLDRDYADWNAYKALLPDLGVKRARFFSGWAKTEQEKNVYDFTWLDPQIRECVAMGIKPWICISYGNPVWGSDFRLGMRVSQVTENPEAFDAWIRYTKALVARYKDVVQEWEIWNEPFGQAKAYAELFYRTACAIREIQPEAKIFCTALSFSSVDMAKSDYAVVLEKLKKENALGLANRFIYHPYHGNPDKSYDWMAFPLRKLVKGYSASFDVMQGEAGCPAQLEFGHALSNIEWSEYAQAKWLLRRTIGDAARRIPCNVFTMIDLKYTFMLQSFGLVRSNLLKEFVYRRPSYFAMQNVFSLFDGETEPLSVATDEPFTLVARADPRRTDAHKLTCASFSRSGQALRFYWFAEKRPHNLLEFDRIGIRVPQRLAEPVWVDMITGRAFAVDPKDVSYEVGATVLKNLPMWDSPVLIAERSAIPLSLR